MALEEVKLKPFYNSKTDDLIEQFYIPVLSNAKKYKRVSAYFDSNIISLYAKGIENIINNQGHIYFIFSSEITEKDFEIIKNGYEERIDVIDKLVDKVLVESPSYELKNLGYLIKHNYVDIKIAFTKDSGIFHDKFGLIENNASTVYFRGSNNETVASIKSNFESFETTCSWNTTESENKKLINAKRIFDDLWNNRFSNDLNVIDIPNIIKEKLMSFSGDRIIINYENKINSFVMDYEANSVICINNLVDKKYLYPEYSFYKRELQQFVETYTTDRMVFKNSISYLKIKKLIQILNEYANKYSFNIYITPNLRRFIDEYDILIEKRRSLGIAIKNKDSILINSFDIFKNIINKEMVRILREPQILDAFHLSLMMRGANFSVPGAGKTSIVYGAYAYLSAPEINEVNKIVMIGPISSFSSWKKEFSKCFGNKKELKAFDYQKEKEATPGARFDQIAFKEDSINLILFNYESLQNNIEALKHLIDSKTLLVYDEVHRIKSINGKRAYSALHICQKARYRVVLTGTPIPNGYEDLYNMLNILFNDEYETFFGFDNSYLKDANTNFEKQNIINNSIYPFFCRTNKKDLNVPPAESDNIIDGYCITNNEESNLFKIIYKAFGGNILLLYIRLIQASNNPSLILNRIKNEDIKLFNTFDFSSDFTDNDIEISSELTEEDIEFISSLGMTSKFYKGIDLVEKLTKNGTVIVWGIFIDTIHRIEHYLQKRGIRSRVITGSVPIAAREEIIDDFLNGKFQVLITNPQTLAESVSLHMSCHQAVYFEYSFNLVHMLQSRDRIHRLGLKENDKTYYYYLMLDNPYSLFTPIDKKIYKRLLEKEEIQNQALSSKNVIFVEDNIQEDIKMILGDAYVK